MLEHADVKLFSARHRVASTTLRFRCWPLRTVLPLREPRCCYTTASRSTDRPAACSCNNHISARPSNCKYLCTKTIETPTSAFAKTKRPLLKLPLSYHRQRFTDQFRSVVVGGKVASPFALDTIWEVPWPLVPASEHGVVWLLLAMHVDHAHTS